MSLLYDIVSLFFFKQKTAYEMRISDWSSDVCSSDLDLIHDFDLGSHALRRVAANAKDCINRFKRWHPGCPIRDADLLRLASLHAAIMVQFLSESLGQLQWNPSHRTRRKIGRASCRERVCKSV